MISISSINQESKKYKKNLKTSSRGSKKIQDPAIPFPQSQKHFSSKLTVEKAEYASSR